MSIVAQTRPFFHVTCIADVSSDHRATRSLSVEPQRPVAGTMNRRRINVAVVGDKGSGKTSLITSAAQEVFSERPVPVLPPTRFPADFAGVSEPVDLIAYDTSSRPEDTQAVDETIKAADVVVLCFDAQRKITMERLRTEWLPRITRLRQGAPIIIACCKDDSEGSVPMEHIREVGVVVLPGPGGGMGVV